MTRHQLEAVRLIVKNYDMDGLRRDSNGKVTGYYGGVLYDFTEGMTFCIVDRKIANYISGMWYYTIFDTPDVLEKLNNKEPFTLINTDAEDGDYCKAYFYPKGKRHCRKSELVRATEYYTRKKWLIDDK